MTHGVLPLRASVVAELPTPPGPPAEPKSAGSLVAPVRVTSFNVAHDTTKDDDNAWDKRKGDFLTGRVSGYAVFAGGPATCRGVPHSPVPLALRSARPHPFAPRIRDGPMKKL